MSAAPQDMASDWPAAPPGGGLAEGVCRILVVDDSLVQRRILTGSLRKQGYFVAEAASGEEALELLQHTSVDIILSDWMMPGKDGLEFCREFRALRFEKYVYFILLTSKSEREEVALGLDAGADDFLTKPVNASELRARIAAGERILGMAGELSEKNDLLSSALGELRTLYDALDRDLREARKLQESLVPQIVRRRGQAEVASLFRPSGHVGGDLVGHFWAGDAQLGVYAIDVSGHGVASALMTARLAGYLGGSSPEQNVALVADESGACRMRSPAQVCAILNARLLEEMETDLYFTMVLADLDLRTGWVRLAQAGHPRPAVLTAAGEVRFVGDGGLPVGLVPWAGWEDVETRLDPDDRLFLYSDGLTETMSPTGAMLEEAGLAELLRRNRHFAGRDFFAEITRELEAMTGGMFADDVSGVAVRYFGPAGDRPGKC